RSPVAWRFPPSAPAGAARRPARDPPATTARRGPGGCPDRRPGRRAVRAGRRCRSAAGAVAWRQLIRSRALVRLNCTLAPCPPAPSTANALRPPSTASRSRPRPGRPAGAPFPHPEALETPMTSADATPAPGPKFTDLGLPEPLLQALAAVGYESPSPIQAATIPPLLAGRDVLGQAQTGTGKTA